MAIPQFTMHYLFVFFISAMDTVIVEALTQHDQNTGKSRLISRTKLVQLTHSFLTAKQRFPGFLTFFYAIFKLLRPEHDCYAKFTSVLHKETLKQHFEE